MRSMWKGILSFGLVSVPVCLGKATETRDISFRQVHSTDGGRIRFQRVCSACGEVVPYADLAKGYEQADGEIVVLTDSDFADLPLPSAKTIAVDKFVPAGQVDLLSRNGSYYIWPDAKAGKAAAHAYALLRDALADSGKVGIARVALRSRESLAVLSVRGKSLVLTTLLWSDEVREPDMELPEEGTASKAEASMAAQLIGAFSGDFDPADYHDGYREALEAVVAAKVAGTEVAKPAETAEAGSGDLSALLAASIAAAKEK